MCFQQHVFGTNWTFRDLSGTILGRLILIFRDESVPRLEKQDFSFFSLARFLRLISPSTLRNFINWCVLDSPDLGQPFKYLECYHITLRNFFRSIWSQKVRQKLMKTQIQLRLSKFVCFHQFLTNFLTSGGSKLFYMGDVIKFKSFKRLLEIRAL